MKHNIHKSKIKKIKKKCAFQKGAGTGTSGSVTTLFDDMFALSKSIVDTVVNTTELIVNVVELPYDIGVAYTEPVGKLLLS